MSSKRKKSKKRIIILWAVIAIIAISATAAVLLRPKTDTYQTLEAKTGSINSYYSFSGNVEAKNRQTVVSEKVMQISEIKVKEGDQVKDGDVLFTTTTNDEIKAEMDGEVSSINVEENAQVMAGITLMEIVDYDHLKINVKVDEYNLTALKTGKKVTVYVGAIDKELKGTIKSIAKEGQVVNGVTYFTADIDLNKNSSVKVGMSAEVKLVGDSAEDVVTLPMSVIQFDENNQPYVYLENDKGDIVRSDIKTGINDGTTVEVKSGIKSGDTVYYKETSSTSQSGMGFGASQGGE